jgi:hypothetical protein
MVTDMVTDMGMDMETEIDTDYIVAKDTAMDKGIEIFCHDIVITRYRNYDTLLTKMLTFT